MNTNLYNSHITTQEEWDTQKAEYMRRPASERAHLELELKLKPATNQPTVTMTMTNQPDPIITLESFRATRRYVHDLGDILRDESYIGVPGYVYMDGLFIEHMPEEDKLHLLIERSEWLYANTPTALAEMEETLFDYGNGEHFNFDHSEQP